MAIAGVDTKRLDRNNDERGFFMELARLNVDPFFGEPGVAQVSTALRRSGVVAWHLHPTQVDWWCVLEGEIEVGLLDRRKPRQTRDDVQTLRMADSDDGFVLKIPAGVAHGYKIVRGPLRMLYFASRTYDPREELRLDPMDPELVKLHDWSR